MKRFIFLIFFLLITPGITYAQSATTACAGVVDKSANPALANDSTIANGFQECVEQYTACIETSASGDTCGTLARQYGQAKYSFTLWAKANPTADPSTNSDYRTVGTMATQLEEVMRAARVANMSNQIGNPTEAPPVTSSSFGNTTSGNGQNQTQTRGTAAQDGNLDYTPLEPLPGLTNVQSGRDRRLADMLQAAFRILISLGGFSAVIMLVFGGVTYMMSDVVHKKTAALKRVQAALWGILLLVASWLILRTINPQLLTFELLINPAPHNQTGSGLRTVTSGTTGNLTVADNDPNLGTKLSTWCSKGRPDPISADVDEFGTRFSTYTCAAADSQ